MGRVTTAVEHLRVEEIDARINQLTQAWRIRRWLVIGCALVHPKPAAEIAQELGLARQTVHNLVAAYNRGGAAAIETPGKGQRQRAYLSLRGEQAVVDKFLKQSAKGQVSRGLKIRAALEKAVGHKVAKTTLYRVLKRHQWRKVVPRPYHPQSSPNLSRLVIMSLGSGLERPKATPLGTPYSITLNNTATIL
jgi:transposase